LFLKWKDGICVDRAIQLLEKNGINYELWKFITFNREVSYSTNTTKNINKLGIDTNDYDVFVTQRELQRKILREFHPKYQKHLQDEASVIAIELKKEKFCFDDEELEAEIREELEAFHKANRFYYNEEILINTGSYQDIVYKVNGSIDRAFERFFEDTYTKMDADLTKKEAPVKKIIDKV
jgi:hypothetical protein